MNRFRLFSALLSLALLLCACAPEDPFPADTGTEAPVTVSSSLTVYFLNVGKADCILLQTENHLVLIDAGHTEDGNNAVEAIEALGADKVDCLILSHPDKDHIGGAPAVIATGKVEAVYQADYDKGSSEQRKLNSAIASTPETKAVTVTRTLSFEYDGVKFTVYPTALDPKGSDTSNERSLGVLVEHGNNRLFFAGDAVGERLSEMVSQIPDPASVDLLKIPHHGRFDSRSDELIEALMPSVAVICCDSDNMPDNRLLTLLNQVHADRYLTCNGIVMVVSNGNFLHVEE